MTAPPATYTISQLAAETAIPIPRIKFYLREGLLPGGDLRAQRRAFYGDGHVRRLRLIHALRGVAGLSVPAIFDLCKLLDQGGGELPAIIAHVIDALGSRERAPKARHAAAETRARRELVALLRAQGMQVRPHAKAVTDLARALNGLREVLGPGLPVDALEPYLTAMCRLAERDFAANAHLLSDAVNAGLAATLGTVMWEPVLLLARRFAHEHVANQMLGPRRRAAKRKGG